MTSLHAWMLQFARTAFTVIVVTALSIAPSVSLAADEKVSDVGMFLLNVERPFVSRSFAEQLGRLVMTEKFKQAILVASPPDVQDKNDIWWVTFKVAEWKSPERIRTMLASQVSISIRKSDGAIVAIK
jgi:hypothetical protein